MRTAVRPFCNRPIERPDLDIADLRQKINRLVLADFLSALNFKVIYARSPGVLVAR